MARSDRWTSGRPDLKTTAEEEKAFRSRVERRAKTVRLPRQKLEKWEMWCHVNKMDFQELTEQGIELYFEKLDVQTSTIRSDDLDRSMTPLSSSGSSVGRPDGQSLDDEKEKHLLGFYCAATGNRLKTNDKAVYKKELASLEPHLVKIGITTSLLRAKERINSLRYCLGAIEEAAEQKLPLKYLEYLIWSVNNRPMYEEMLGPEKRGRLTNAFNLQPTLPGVGAELVDIHERKETDVL